jgi:hypothetical protein
VASVGGVSGCAWRGRRGTGAALRRDVAAQGAAGQSSILLILGLNTVYSKILNKIAQHFEYESCNLAILYHFQKDYSVFLNRFSRWGLPTLNATQLP